MAVDLPPLPDVPPALRHLGPAPAAVVVGVVEVEPRGPAVQLDLVGERACGVRRQVDLGADLVPPRPVADPGRDLHALLDLGLGDEPLLDHAVVAELGQIHEKICPF
jgi:hypothetical protein